MRSRVADALIAAALASCAVEPAAVRSPGGPIELTVVDASGRPVPGARVDFSQLAGWLSCDLDARPGPTYAITGTGTTGDDGRFALRDSRLNVRVVAPDRTAAYARVDRDTTLAVRPTSTVTIEPRCDGAACGAFEAWGTLAIGDARCEIRDLGRLARDRIVLPGMVAGALELYLHSSADTDDERYTVVHANIDRDGTLAPPLPRVAGPYIVRGTITVDGQPPGGPDYATSVIVQCGDAPSHVGRVDAASGRFTVEHLPARACTMHVSSDATDVHHQRDVTVHPAEPSPVAVAF